MIKPLRNNIIILPIEEEQKSTLIIPESVKKPKPNQGKVLAVGNKTLEVKVGDHVIFEKHAGDEVDIKNGKKGLIMSENHIILIKTKK